MSTTPNVAAELAGPLSADDPYTREPRLWRAPGTAMVVVAHRGACSAAPENTLMAQEIARRGGADWIETDVQLSRDGVPFILNDRTVDRTTDGSGPIDSFLAEELKRLDAGSWFAPVFAGLRLPTLAEQLSDLADRGGNLLLELKGQRTADEVAAILALVAAVDLPGRVAVQSFEESSIRHARETAPDLPRALLRPVLDDDPVSIAGELGLTSYNIKGSALLERPAAVKELHGAGVAVFVWSIDSAQQWAEFERVGVDGIITNRPTELAGWNAADPHRA